MRQRVIFLMYHGQGHFNPCFMLAKILRREYDVIFAGHLYFKNYVEGQGFPYYPLRTVPFGLGFEAWINSIEKKKNIYWNTLKDRWSDRLYFLREAELVSLLNEINPSYLFIDSAQSTDFIVLYHELKARKIGTAIIHANLSTITTADLPPLNSPILPDDPAKIKRAHLIFNYQRLKKSLIQGIRFFGKSNEAIVRKRISINTIPAKHIWKFPSLFSIGLDHIDHLIMAPFEFEFPSATRSRHHYLGFMIDTGRIEKTEPQFKNVLAEIDQKIAAGHRLIYCSFGTVQYDNLKKVKSFLKRLLSILSESSDILLVSGNAADQSSKQNLPSNVFVFSSVPHFQVFPRASVFITHGGFNSIKESIFARVPMLVYPVDLRTDQAGNAARIVYHNVGLRGDLSKDSSDDIRYKIKVLVTSPVYKDNIDKLLIQDRAYTDDAFLNLVKKIQPL